MTARTHVWLISAFVAALALSIVLWCVLVFRWSVSPLCFFGPCDADVRVSGQLPGTEVPQDLRCELELVEPTAGATGQEPVFVARDPDGRFDTALPANPWRDRYRVVITCPGGRTFRSPEFSRRELAAHGDRLELGTISLSPGGAR